MVTYDPNLAILARSTSRGIPQVHVQYFGISAMRGWVSQLQYEPLVDLDSHKLPVANIGRKMRCEFEVAVREAAEALGLTHKERKLKFIFSFDPPSSPVAEGRVDRRVKRESRETEGATNMETAALKHKELEGEDKILTEGNKELEEGEGNKELEEGEGNKRVARNDRRRSSTNCPPVSLQNNMVPASPRASSRRRRIGSGAVSVSGDGGEGGEDVAEKNFVVSLSINGLGTPAGMTPSLQVGQSPTTVEDMFAVPVNTVLNQGRSDSCKPPNGIVVSPTVTMGRGRQRKNSTRQNFRRVPPLGKRKEEEEEGGGVRARRGVDVLTGPPPVKRLALDPGSESGSETSGVSIASAILTPPSSGTEAVGEEEVGGAKGVELGAEADEKRVGRRKGGRTKLDSVQRKTKSSVAPTADGARLRDGECAICDARDSGLLACQGHCFQTFHIDCLGLIQPPTFKFVCDECQAEIRQCFVCSKSSGQLECCGKPRCGKFYHRSCIHDDRLFVFDNLKSSKFTCPLHYCAKCVCSDLGTSYTPRGSSLVQCVKCPLALHKPHCLIAGCNLISPTHMVCYLHIRIDSELNLYKHLNMDNCLECGDSGSLYCCDFCSSAYHRGCVEEHQLPAEEEEEGSGRGRGVGSVSQEKWICPACRDHDLPTYDSVVLCKFGVWR